jgi:hypothetical protein
MASEDHLPVALLADLTYVDGQFVAGMAVE